jgi:hypothetical protein
MKVSGMVDFWGARLGFLLLAACLAPLTAYLSYTFLPQRWGAILAGSLAIFSGFYYAYLPTTETFGIYMILGIVIFLLIRKLQQDWLEIKESNDEKFTSNRWQTIMKIRFVSPIWIYLLLGGMTGLMYLTRADGLLWFGISLLAIFIQDYARKTSKQSVEFKGFGIKSLLISLCLCIIGFLMIISPWVLRNLLYFGSVIAPGSSRAIWLTDYDDLFIYPASQLTFERWIETGSIEILRTRGWAFGLNLMSSFAVQGAILLSPLIAVGMWVKRRDWRVRLGALAWLSILLIMTLIFPFQGARGGFFHAGAALQPLFWALVPVGLMSFVKWGESNRRWHKARALRVFSIGLVAILILMTFFSTWQRLKGRNSSAPAWGETEMAYPQVDEFLIDLNASLGSIVMVNNPPGYYVMTGRPAIVIPDGDLNTSIQAGKRYSAGFLILDENHPQGLKKLYEDPKNYPGLTYLDSLGKMRVFLLEK